MITGYPDARTIIFRWSLHALLLLLSISGHAQCSFYTVTMEDGDGDTEISWSLVDQDGTVWASAGSPYENTLCLPDGCYTLLMYDAGGDRWDGLEWDIDADDSNWDQQATLVAGAQGQIHFATGPGACGNAADCAPGLSPVFIEATAGGSPNQMSWLLLFNGVQVSSGGSDTRDTLCLPPGCLVLEQFDSGGNGWQTGTVSVSDGSGNVWYEGTLASGSFGTVNVAVNGGDCLDPGGTGPGVVAHSRAPDRAVDVVPSRQAGIVLWPVVRAIRSLSTSHRADQATTTRCLHRERSPIRLLRDLPLGVALHQRDVCLPANSTVRGSLSPWPRPMFCSSPSAPTASRSDSTTGPCGRTRVPAPVRPSQRTAWRRSAVCGTLPPQVARAWPRHHHPVATRATMRQCSTLSRASSSSCA